jgi:hypothetical protein
MRVAPLKEAYPTAKVELCGVKTSTAWASSRSSARCGVSYRRKALCEGPIQRYEWTSTFITPLHAPEERRGPLADPTDGQRSCVFSLALEHFAKEIVEQAPEGASCWCSIEPDGPRARRLRFPKG